MDEAFGIVFGCSIAAAIPGLLIWVLYRFHRRLKAIETSVSSLERRLGWATRPEAAPDRPATAVMPAEPTAVPEPPPAPVAAAAPLPEPFAKESPVEPPPFVVEPPPAPEIEPPPPPEVEPPPAVEPPSGPPPAPWWSGLEENLGARLPVWIGAIALVLAAAFLVKVSIDRGWLSPAIRVTLGVLFGVALLVTGEVLRRKSRYVAQGLSAAGVAALFVAFYAASALYQLISPWAGFGLMALTTAVAVVLSLRQGVIVATIGLVGGFLTPQLVGTSDTRPALLFAYLLLLQVGLVAVTRRRRWWFLGVLTLLAGLFWVLSFLGGAFDARDAIWVGLFLLGSIVTFVASILSGGAGAAAGGGWGDTRVAAGLGWGALGGGLIATASLTYATGYGTQEWLFLGLVGLGALVLARLREGFHGLAWLAPAVIAFDLLGWIGKLQAQEATRFFWTHGLLGAVLAAGAYLAHRRSAHPGKWASLCSTVGVVFLLEALAAGEQMGLGDVSWGTVALLVAIAYVLAALPVARQRQTAEGDARAACERVLAALAVGVTTLISLAVPMELERQWMTVAWAAEVLALVWLAERLDVPTLRRLAWILLVFVAIRLLANPLVVTEYPIGETPLFNWLLYGYGLPILALAGASVLARRQGAARLAEALHWVCLALVVAFVSLEIRQYFHRSRIDEEVFLLVEWGAYVIAWLGLAWGALRLARRHPARPFEWGGRILTVAGIVLGTLSLGLGSNPLWGHWSVGETLVVNRLLWCYGVPALMLFVLVRELESRKAKALSLTCAIASLATVFVLVTLEVRQAFHGTWLDVGTTTNAEQYAYSFAWIVLGLVLVVAGIASRARMLRYASLAVLLPAVFKVFLFDTANLEDLYRVFSLLALGVSLMLLAFLYKRFVFRDEGGS